MIYIFEKLTESELKRLTTLEPYMDFEYSRENKSFYWQTRFDKFELINGKKTEIRKARLFRLNQIKAGFLCDDVFEAKFISLFIRREIDCKSFKRMLKHDYESHTKLYNIINEYLLSSEMISIRYIALSVKSFCEHYRGSNHLLDILDKEELLEDWNIDVYNCDGKKNREKPPN